MLCMYNCVSPLAYYIHTVHKNSELHTNHTVSAVVSRALIMCTCTLVKGKVPG